MSGDRVPDSERLLMESIRALEEEQLEVEEVDDDSRPSSSGDSRNLAQTFRELHQRSPSVVSEPVFSVQILRSVPANKQRREKSKIYITRWWSWMVVLLLICLSSTLKTLIARSRDMVVMSSDGPLNAFVNPYGHVHEIMTLNNTKGLVLLDGPVTEHSWFPGYKPNSN